MTKEYPGVRALDSVSVAFEPGETHQRQTYAADHPAHTSNSAGAIAFSYLGLSLDRIAIVAENPGDPRVVRPAVQPDPAPQTPAPDPVPEAAPQQAQ